MPEPRCLRFCIFCDFSGQTVLESEVGNMVRSGTKLLLLAAVLVTLWIAWALAAGTQSESSIPIDAKFVRREAQYEAI